ncbi:hypothetical protein F5X99DRAFT_175960 [Biscogniauxia marginata]|nr:hypothetical protein F5X99DRAFT_175960 [Biscogniauxia marginata]
MCVDRISTYPCGHTKVKLVYCRKAKAANLLRVRKPNTHCGYTSTKQVEPDLEDSCGSTCLTKPYECLKCKSSRKQVSWRCADCGSVRDNDSLLWDSCQCPMHDCTELALGKGGSICRKCLRDCVPGTPVLCWKCHACESPNRTWASEMICTACHHTRCGKCRALFSCSCGCRCRDRYVEGGSKACNKCVKTCSKP